MGQHLRSRPAIRIVTITQHLQANCFRLGVFALGDAVLGKLESTRAESAQSVVVRFLAYHRVRQKVERHTKFLMRHREFFLGHGRFASRKGFFASRKRLLAAGSFAVRDVIDVLRETIRAYPRQENGGR